MTNVVVLVRSFFTNWDFSRIFSIYRASLLPTWRALVWRSEAAGPAYCHSGQTASRSWTQKINVHYFLLFCMTWMGLQYTPVVVGYSNESGTVSTQSVHGTVTLTCSGYYLYTWWQSFRCCYITVNSGTTALQNGACTFRCISKQMHYKTLFSHRLNEKSGNLWKCTSTSLCSVWKKTTLTILY